MTIGLVSIVVLSVTAISTFSIVFLTLEEKTQEQLASESIIQGETIRTFFDLKIQQIQNLAKNQAIQKTINDVNRLEDGSKFQIMIEEKRVDFSDAVQKARSNLNYSLELDDLYILGQDGKTYFSLNHEINEKDFSNIFDSVTGSKTSFIKFNSSLISNNENAIIAVPIFVSEENIHSEPMGIIIASVNISEINNILQKPFTFTTSDESFLVNQDHMTLLKSDSKEKDALNVAINNLPIKMCFDEQRNYYGKYMNRDDQKVYGFSYCLADFGLVLLTEINESEVLNPITSLQQTFLFIGIVVVMGIVVLSFSLSRSLSKPIMMLKDAADEIAKGNFNVRSKIKSGDEIEQLSVSFDAMAEKIQDSLEKIKQKDMVIQEQHDLLLEFSENRQKCCVGVIDIVSSTKITANLSDVDTSNFYGIFINFMASIVNKFDGIVVKNIGDALLFYFPHTNPEKRESFENVIDCCMSMINAHREINSKMDEKGLSSFSYRISAVYGSVMIAQMSTSSVVDIFGSTVNVCTKINSLARPNELVIGENLYDIIKSYNKFIFKQKEDYFVNDQTRFKVYSVKNTALKK